MDLCWFCGCAYDKKLIVSGLSIGSMVYGSYLKVSESSGFGKTPLPSDEAHSNYDVAKICHRCVTAFKSDAGDLDPGKLARLIENKDLVINEVVSYDTCLKSFEDRIHYFGCWFGEYPISGLETRFNSLSLEELYDRGLRLSGGIRFGRRELDRFLGCFGSSGHHSQISKEKLDYFSNAFMCISDADAVSISRIRCCIFDVTIAHDLKSIFE